MDYYAAARKLLALKTSLEHFPLNRHLLELTRGEFFVLDYLNQKNAVNPKELSRVMSVSTARVAVLLKHMEEKGWILKTLDPRDSRQILVSITESGISTFEARYRETLLQAAALLKALGPEDAKSLLRIEEKIIHIFSSDLN
ncbi:MAG TPA: MarR family transcriptional regulator [Candidatus Choladousia intestinigallinarum]|nr:MarR family transcriptional regulator [Candidatus Choladousia intestinigallinarum]